MFLLQTEPLTRRPEPLVARPQPQRSFTLTTPYRKTVTSVVATAVSDPKRLYVPPPETLKNTRLLPPEGLEIPHFLQAWQRSEHAALSRDDKHFSARLAQVHGAHGHGFPGGRVEVSVKGHIDLSPDMS